MTNFYRHALQWVSLLFLLTLPAVAAAFTVEGRFMDVSASEPCSAVSFNIYAAGDTVRPVLSSAADLDGRFSTDLSSPGSYLLRADYPGMKRAEVPFTLSSDNPKADLGDIALSPDGNLLQEVVVVARKDLISSDGAKLTYDAEHDPVASTNSVIEMLRRVPMVSVDGEDNIKVKGQSNFKIYVNGKPDPMLSGDPKSVLKAMPASSIKKIEVITDPGAKYEAEGTAGILNIITVQKQSLQGYSANLNAFLRNGSAGGSAYFRTKIHNVTVAARASTSLGDFWRPHTYSSLERENLNDDTNRFYRSKDKSLSKFNYSGGSINLSWEPDTLNLFTVSANLTDLGYKSQSRQNISMSSIDEIQQWSYRRDIDSKGNTLGLTANIAYQHTFPSNKAHTLTFTYQYDYVKDPTKSITGNYDYVDFPGAKEPWQKHDTHTYKTINTLQADYSLPLFHDKHTFEAGAKAVIRPDRLREEILLSETGEEYTQNSCILMTQHNDVYAGYVSYNASFGKFSSRAGLRYEHTRLGNDYRRLINSGDYKDFSRHLNDWVPNASLTYKLSQTGNIRASYAMRIRRPNISAINPFENDLSYGSLSYGNPNLDSEKRHNVELKYSNYGNKFSGELSVQYAQTNNSINSYSFMQDGILHTTYDNIGRDIGVDFGAYGEYQITTDMNLSIYAGAYYANLHARDENNTKNHGWQGNVNINYGYSMPLNFRLDAYGGFWTPWISLQSKGQTGYYYGLNLSRTFLKDNKLRLSLSASSFLEGRKKGHSTSHGAGYRQTYVYDYAPWNVGLSITYSFGSLKSDVKRTRSSIDNNDTTKDSSGSSSRT